MASQRRATEMTSEPPVVICGGGIIGCATAYYLAKRGVSSLIIEQTGIASGSSGNAGGFLAANWNSGPVGDLARKSFEMHAGLQEELGAPIDYRRMRTLSISFQGDSRDPECPDWVTGKGSKVTKLGGEATTAQVHPYKLSQAFLKKAQDLGHCEARLASVTGVRVEGHQIKGVRLASGDLVPCSKAVFAMGPWTGRALGWLGLPSHLIFGHRAHAVILEPQDPIPADALFTEIGDLSPEVYPRPDGTVYVCGAGDDPPLPETTAKVQVDPKRARSLVKAAGVISEGLRKGAVFHEQACYLPVSSVEQPLLCAVPKVSGAFLAAGHSCWGILNAPASGLLMSELIVDGKCSFMDAGVFALTHDLLR